MISACIPTLRPLVVRLLSIKKLASSSLSSFKRKIYQKTPVTEVELQSSGIESGRGADYGSSPSGIKVTISSDQRKASPERGAVLLDQISVQQEIRMTSEEIV